MKFVYSFSEGNKDMKNLLGGKGANLAEMTNLKLPVPQGFTITTEACLKYYEDKGNLSENIVKEIMKHIKELENKTGKIFGDINNPLLLSVRSGARSSMPGMMDTVLNLGLNDEVVDNFSKKLDDPRFIYDSYRRFIQMYSDVVMNFPKSFFERLLDDIKKDKKVTLDYELTVEDLKDVIKIYKKEYKKHLGVDFPTDPIKQLLTSVSAVFESWNNERAITYRKLNDIPASWGTAVNVQEMVYGNRGLTSGTGVAFTRNPATGEKKLFGEYLMNAQGEDVVAGIRTPKSIDTLNNMLPECYREFIKICDVLENHYKDMQDMEFTIENGKLYILQTRNGKRTAEAAIKIAVDLVKEKMISKEEALLRVEPKMLDQLLHPTFDKKSLLEAKAIANGLAASPGSATGKIYFNVSDMLSDYKHGEKEMILVRLETSPEDILGMNIANGILTIRGGMTSHAAVVARGMGKCCISGCNSFVIDEKLNTITSKNGTIYKAGDFISLDGSTGNVYEGKISTVDPQISGDFETFMNWADDIKKLKVRANADNYKDSLIARNFKSEGIGLCRTEHMFFEEERIFNFRKMIIADTIEEREKALNKILPYQRGDFEKLFKSMEGYGVTIRFLDPPLHEFLPKKDSDIKLLAESLNISFKDVKEKVESLKEFNPMMGHRGCRLAITYEEIAKMQTKAVIEAAINVKKEGIKVLPEIMIPLICDINELKYIKNIITTTAEEIMKNNNISIDYKIGTMIEIPRACLIADLLAEEVDFFSFGTNDLTQMTYGFSRDDAAKFLGDYYNKQIFDFDPFAKLDQEGVGSLIKIAITKARKVKPNIKIGICGEHGGETSSIDFCNNLDFTYVSCSPYRVPIARLAAAQSVLKTKYL